LIRHGACVHHRRSFSPVAAVLARGEVVLPVSAVAVESTNVELQIAQ